MDEKIKELFEQPAQGFAEHLAMKNNYRIIFSGRFGIGKTTFLKYFFSEENNTSSGTKYNAVHLFPVNYQVSDNKDIFEYIKYDIIAHLLSVKEIELEKIDIPAFQTIPYLLLQRPADVLAPLLHFFGGTVKLAGEEGKVVGTVISESEKLYKNYEKLINKVYSEHKELQKDEQKSLLSFLKKAEQQQGSIYENDFYTELIGKLLQRWKESTDDRETVLVIDDLDRIDPQHAFRLFNIFSAHFDYENEHENKFGFDKVVFVCDIDNIRNIFASNYGVNVDFSGYIDKFYSKQIHHFDNLVSLEAVVGKWIKIYFSSNYTNSTYAPDEHIYDERTKLLKMHLYVVLLIMIRANAINLRALRKLPKISSNSSNEKWLSVNGEKMPKNQFVINLFDILVHLVGEAVDLMGAFENCRGKFNHHFGSATAVRQEDMLESVLGLLGYGKVSKEKRETVEEMSLYINYQNVQNSELECSWATISGCYDEKGNSTEKMPDIFLMYQKALQLLINVGHY